MKKCRGICLFLFTALTAVVYLCTSEAPTDLSSPEQAYSTIILSSTSLRVSDTTVIDSVKKPIDISVVMHAGIFIDSVYVNIYSGLLSDVVYPDTVIIARFGENDLRDTLRYQITFETPGIKSIEVISYKKLDYVAKVTASAFILGKNESNSPPVFVPETPKDVYRFAEGDLVKIPVKATDYNNDLLTYYFLFSETPLPRDSTATLSGGFFTWQSKSGDKGIYPVIFRVHDPYSFATTKTTIVVGDTSFNSPPHITSTPVATAQSGILYRYIPKAVDDEEGTLSWTLTGELPQDMVFDTVTGTISWIPAPGVLSSGKLTLTVKDDGEPPASSSQTVQIDVAGANTSPVAYSRSVATAMDMPLDIIMYASDPDDDRLTYHIVKNPPFGTASVKNDSVIAYKPGVSFKGVDTIRFVVNDALSSSDTARILVYVAYDNLKPVAVSKQVIVREDESSVITLSASDAEGKPLTYAIINEPGFGVLSGITENRTYTPNVNYNGNDTFTFIANDGNLDSDPAMVFISITPVNDTPVVHNIGIPVTVNSPLTIPISVTDPDDSLFTTTILTLPQHGTAEDVGSMTIRYVPDEDFTGTDTIQYIVTDEQGCRSNVARIIIVAGGTDAKPVADSQTVTVQEDSVVAIMLGGSDPEGQALTYTVVKKPLHGALTGTGSSLMYRPNINYNGYDTLQFLVNDGILDSDPAKVIISILAVNDAPVVTAQSYTTSPAAAVMVPLSAQDVDDSKFTFKITLLPKHGTLDTSGLSGGYVRYTPDAGSQQNDTIRYQAFDLSGKASNEAAIVIFILTVNQRPVATPLRVDINEDATQPIFLSGEDETPSQNLIYSITVPPKHGTFEGNFPNISYKTEPNYNGQDTFWYKVSDGSLESDPARVVITIHPVNDPPVVSLISVSTGLGTQVSITLQAYDVDDLAFTFKMTSGPRHGIADTSAINSGIIRYTPFNTPDTVFKGLDTLTYQAFDDETWASNMGYVIIAVALDNQPPVALPDTVTLREDDSLLITLEGRDLETDKDKLVYTVSQSPSHGSLVNKSGRTVWYKPFANYNGTDALFFTVSDSARTSGAARVLIVITPVNDPPVAEPKTLNTGLGTPLLITLSGSDPDGITGLTFRVVAPMPLHGAVDTTTIRTGTVTYTPVEGYKGMDTIRFVARDVEGEESPAASIVIGVALDNQPPVAEAQEYQLAEDLNTVITLRGSDVEHSPLVFYIDSMPKHGLLMEANDETQRIYRPDSNFNGTDSLYYHAYDGQLSSETVKIRLIVTPVNDRPAARDTALTGLSEDVTVQFELPCRDVDGDPLTVDVVDEPDYGTLTVLTGTTCRYVPDPEYYGADAFTFYVRDAVMPSETVTVSLVIESVNDTPVAVAPSEPVQVVEDGHAEFSLSGTDVDGDSIRLNIPTQTAAHGVLSVVNQTVTYTPDHDFWGQDSFSFTVSDGSVQSHPALVRLDVQPVNDPPTIDDIALQIQNQAGGFDDVVLDNYLHDIDDEIADITWEVTGVSSNDISAVITPSRTLAATLENAAMADTVTVTVRATDTQNGFAEKSIRYTVPEDVPPVVTPPHDTITNENTTLGPIGFTVGDDGNVNALNITFSSSDPQLIQQMIPGGNGANRTITVVPVADRYGEATITITADDGNSSTNASFSVIVNGQPVVSELTDAVQLFGNAVAWRTDEVAKDPENTTVTSILFTTDGTNWSPTVTTHLGTIAVDADSIRYTSISGAPDGYVPPFIDTLEYLATDDRGFRSVPAKIAITIHDVIIDSFNPEQN